MRQATGLVPLILVVVLGGCGDRDASPGGADAASGPVGHWELDAERFQASVEAMMQEQLEGMDPERRKLVEPRMREMVEGLSQGTMEATIEADGTFRMTSVSPEGKAESGEGIWKREGDGFALVMTKQDGKAVEPGSKDAEPFQVKLEGGFLVSVPEEGSGDPPITLRRK